LTGLPAVAGEDGGDEGYICEAKIIKADCESFKLFTDSYPGTIDFTLVLSQGDCSADNIVVKGSVEHGDVYRETVELFWEDFCFDGDRSVQDVLTDGDYTISGCVNFGSTSVCIPPETFTFVDCPEDVGEVCFDEDGNKRKAPTSLTFEYTGGECSASDNDQDPRKATCSGEITGEPVSIVAGKIDNKTGTWKTLYAVTPSTVNSGQWFTIEPAPGKNQLENDSNFVLTDTGTQELKIHTSCSQILEVGDVFGAITLRGFTPGVLK
jgi:hypothetical protein